MVGLTTILTLIQRCQSAIIPMLSPEMVTFYKEHCIYLPAMAGWFVFSVLLSLYNKFVFGKDHMGFPCPLLMTSVHFLSQWIFSYFVSRAYPITLGGDQVSNMSWAVFLGIAIPCGLVTSADVGFSNLALVRISITFYTMVKASAPIFVVLSAYLFGIEKITSPLILVVLIIIMGELLTVMGEGVQFDLIGFILCFIASILSGMRWTVVQLKIQSLEPKLKSTIATMRILSPFMFVTMLFISLVLEKPWSKLGEWIDSPENVLLMIGLALVGAWMAICMIICEFYLIMKSNAIVLMIGGVVKELNTIFFGVCLFGDRLNAVNVLGCVVVFAGVILYKMSLHVKKLEKNYDLLLKESDEDNGGNMNGDNHGDVHGDAEVGESRGRNKPRNINAAVYNSLNKNEPPQDAFTLTDSHSDFVIDDDDDDAEEDKQDKENYDKTHSLSHKKHEII